MMMGTAYFCARIKELQTRHLVNLVFHMRVLLEEQLQSFVNLRDYTI